MMLLGGTFSVTASKFIGYPSAGALGCITIAFVAAVGWKRRTGVENVGVKARKFNRARWFILLEIVHSSERLNSLINIFILLIFKSI